MNDDHARPIPQGNAPRRRLPTTTSTSSTPDAAPRRDAEPGGAAPAGAAGSRGRAPDPRAGRRRRHVGGPAAYDELGRPVRGGGAPPAAPPAAPRPPRAAAGSRPKGPAGRPRGAARVGRLRRRHAGPRVVAGHPRGHHPHRRPAGRRRRAHLPARGHRQPRGPDGGGAQGARRRRQRQRPAHRLDHPRAHPERLGQAGAHLGPARQLPRDPRGRGRTRSTPPSPSAARSCSPRPWSRPPACPSTATSRSASAGSPGSSTASAASRCA